MVFSGEERALVEEAVQEVRARVLQPGLEDFNFDKLSGKQTSIEEMVGKANMMPMMASCRLVEIQDAQDMDGDESILESYLKNPSPTTVLLLIFDKLDMRQKLSKMLDALTWCGDFGHLQDAQLTSWIQKKSLALGLQVSGEVAELIEMVVGNDLLLIERALEKLALALNRSEVTIGDVSEHIASTRIEDAFLLGRAVAAGDRKKALEVLENLKEAREAPVKLVGLLAWQLRQITRARILLDEHSTEPEISRSLNLYGDRLRPVIAVAKRWPLAAHMNRFSKLRELDQMLKSSRAPSWLLFERTVMQLCPK